MYDENAKTDTKRKEIKYVSYLTLNLIKPFDINASRNSTNKI